MARVHQAGWRCGCMAACGAAQPGERMRRIGVLMGRAADDAEGQKQAAVLQRALEELHWSSPHNVEIEYRWAAGDPFARRRRPTN